MSGVSEELHYIVREPPDGSRSNMPLLILLHGYGANEQDLMDLAPFLDPRCLIISVRAPYAVDFSSFGWFPIEFTESGIILHFDEAVAACDQLSRLVASVTANYPVDAGRVILLGFSQGASLSVAVALNEPERFAAVAALSGRFVPEVMPEATESVRGFPIFMTHGEFDQIIPISQGREGHELLSQLPLDLTYTEYPMGHEINQECLEDVRRWITQQIERNQESATEPSL